ncbi:MAG: thermonuclease family protein [Thermosphaera sp.]
MRRALVFWLIAFLLVQPVFMTAGSGVVGVHEDFPHARVVVTRVVDGDTFHITPPVKVGGAYRTVVRLADISAPESSTPQGGQARDALIGLLAQHGNVVYLDIDKASGVDQYGRIIAVAYVRVSETHLLNVNKWMVENGYAVVNDYGDNDFDPSQWSLYVEYPVGKENLPEIIRVPICESCSISNSTSWGVRVATTLDRRYLAVAWSDSGAPYALRVRVYDSSGALVNSYDYTPDKGPAMYANVFRGMLDIAGNETGFLIAWTNYTYESYNRTVLFSYIPAGGGDPTPPRTIFSANYQYHPTVTYFIHSNGTKWWVVGYGRQTTTASNYTFNLINMTPSYTGRFFNFVLAGGATNDPSTTPRIGVDVLGKLVYDSATQSFAIIARVNASRLVGGQGGSVDHNIVAIVGRSHPTWGFSVTHVEVDSREGGQGPEPDIYRSGNNYYSYYNLFPGVFTATLGSGGYVITVYNETDRDLAYGIVNLSSSNPNLVRLETLVSREGVTTYYPWIASSSSKWLVAWNAGRWVNGSLVTPNEGLLESFVIADYNGSFVRVAYDPGSGLFVIPYAVTDYTGTRNVYMVFYDEASQSLKPWALPIATQPGVHETPLQVAVLTGSPSKIVVIALEGGNLVAYYISENYPQLLNPIPVPEPWIVAVAVSIVTLVSIFLVARRHV